jgi:hypothetical protein
LCRLPFYYQLDFGKSKDWKTSWLQRSWFDMLGFGAGFISCSTMQSGY